MKVEPSERGIFVTIDTAADVLDRVDGQYTKEIGFTTEKGKLLATIHEDKSNNILFLELIEVQN